MSARPNSDPPSDEGADTQTELAQTETELAQVQAERDALEAKLARMTSARRRRLRGAPVGLLAALSCLLVVISAHVVWVHRTLLNTDEFVGTVGPVFSQPGVDSAVATRVTDQLFVQLDVQDRLRNALPPKVSFAAVPISNATEGFVAGQLTKVFASPQFQTLWTATLRTTHQQVVAVLRGQNTKILSTSNGFIIVNTVPLVNQALERVSGLASNLTGKHVTLPTITSIDPPQKAVDKLSAALGVQLPSSFGQITLIRSKNLSTVQEGVKDFDRLAIALPLITIAIIALALWLSRARRRTLIQIVVGSSLLLIVARRVVLHTEGTIASHARNPQVAQSVLNELLHGLFVLTASLLWIALGILVVALLTGPYRWAVALRSFVTRTVHQVGHQLTGERRALLVTWMASHANALQIAGAVVAGILFLIVSVSWLSFLIIGGLLAAYEVFLQRIKPTSPDEPSPPPDPDSTLADLHS
jgi:hypothetical protein